MAEAVEQPLGPCEGLVITRYGYDRPCKSIEILQAAHPVPDTAGAAAPAPMLALVISDVPGDDMAYIASGPTVGDDSTAADALAILQKYNIEIPVSVREVLAMGTGVLPTNHPVFDNVENRIVAAPSQSMEAASKLARSWGYDVHLVVNVP